MNANVTPQRSLSSFTFDYAALAFVIKQLIGRIITIVPVRVIAVTGSGDLASCPYVDVQPLLKQRTGSGTGIDHGVVYGVPAWRLQSGSAAIVCDPVSGDVGLALVAYRDIAPLKAADQASPGSLQNGGDTYNVGSKAQYDWGSALYLGGWFNGAVAQYIQLTESLVKIVAPSINLNGAIVNSSGDVASTNGFTGVISIQNSTTTLTVVNGIITGHT